MRSARKGHIVHTGERTSSKMKLSRLTNASTPPWSSISFAVS